MVMFTTHFQSRRSNSGKIDVWNEVAGRYIKKTINAMESRWLRLIIFFQRYRAWLTQWWSDRNSFSNAISFNVQEFSVCLANQNNFRTYFITLLCQRLIKQLAQTVNCLLKTKQVPPSVHKVQLPTNSKSNNYIPVGRFAKIWKNWESWSIKVNLIYSISCPSKKNLLF